MAAWAPSDSKVPTAGGILISKLVSCFPQKIFQNVSQCAPPWRQQLCWARRAAHSTRWTSGTNGARSSPQMWKACRVWEIVLPNWKLHMLVMYSRKNNWPQVLFYIIAFERCNPSWKKITLASTSSGSHIHWNGDGAMMYMATQKMWAYKGLIGWLQSTCQQLQFLLLWWKPCSLKNILEPHQNWDHQKYYVHFLGVPTRFWFRLWS